MNHLQEAKDMAENLKAYDGQEEIIAHALIAIAEQQKRIAEQLEELNKSDTHKAMDAMSELHKLNREDK